MATYVLRRLSQTVIVLLGVSVAVFLMGQLVPGDPAVVMLGPAASADAVAELRRDLGLDESLWIQYGRFIERLVTEGSLGESIRTNREVLDEVFDRLPYTLVLAVLAVTLATILGITGGVVAAINRGKFIDSAILVVTTGGLSVPSFWVALLMIWLFAVRLGWLPVAGAGSWKHLVLPTLTLALPSIATKARLTRSAMLEILNQEYIRTARSKGLHEQTVLLRHALRNALIPVITIVGLQFGALLGGAFITESIFGWPGVGQLAVNSILQRDFPIVQGTVLLVTVSFVMMNLIVDLLYAWSDPRIRYR
ncbi:MAG: ABC transporter permease [Chloroflexota bacterium]|nr:ABC transporter permease [Chloroflexota bacterium]